MLENLNQLKKMCHPYDFTLDTPMTVAYDMWVVGGMDGITDTRLDLVNSSFAKKIMDLWQSLY